jgi:excisionase family DNA binding protein
MKRESIMELETNRVTPMRRASTTLPPDVRLLTWAAEQLGIGTSTAYRLAAAGQMPGAFKVGGQWRISVPRFLTLVHGPVEDIGHTSDIERI